MKPIIKTPAEFAAHCDACGKQLALKTKRVGPDCGVQCASCRKEGPSHFVMEERGLDPMRPVAVSVRPFTAICPDLACDGVAPHPEDYVGPVLCPRCGDSFEVGRVAFRRAASSPS